MFIDSPNFVRRRIVNTGWSRKGKDSEFYQFGRQRNKLINHVTSTLINHQRNEEILENFRKEAEERKKQKYSAKRNPHNSSLLSKSSNYEEKQVENDQATKKNEKKESASPREVKQIDKTPELEFVKKHSNELVEKYRRLLLEKEKELRKKDKRLESSKLALQKMSQRVRNLQKERQLVNQQEEAEFSKIQLTLRQMGSQIAQNKEKVSNKINSLKEQLIPHSEQFPPITEFSIKSPKQNMPQLLKPKKEQLQNIKKKVRSLKINTEKQKPAKPSIIYTKLLTQPSRQPHYRWQSLDKMNKSIVNQSRYCTMSRIQSQLDPE